MHTDTYVAKAHVVGFIMPNFLETKKLPLGAKQLYALLCAFADTKDHCWPSHKTLATRLSCSVSSIKNYLRQLAQHQLIRVSHDSSRTIRSCTYHMLTPNEFQGKRPHSPHYIHTSHASATHAPTTHTRKNTHTKTADRTQLSHAHTTCSARTHKEKTRPQAQALAQATQQNVARQNLASQNLARQNLASQNLAGGQANFGYNLNLNEFKKKPPIAPHALLCASSLTLAPTLAPSALPTRPDIPEGTSVYHTLAHVVLAPMGTQYHEHSVSRAHAEGLGGGVFCTEKADKPRSLVTKPVLANDVAQPVAQPVVKPHATQSTVDMQQKHTQAQGAQSTSNSTFEAFYALYPKKCGKENARKAWNQLHRQGLLPPQDVLLSAIGHAMDSHRWQKDDGRYIPYPATYLRDKRWQDDMGNGATTSHADMHRHGHANGHGHAHRQASEKEKLIAHIAEQKVRARHEELRAIQAQSADFERLKKRFAPSTNPNMAPLRGLYASLHRKGVAPQDVHVPHDAKDKDFAQWLHDYHAQQAHTAVSQ